MASLAGEKIKGLYRFEPTIFHLLLAVHVSVLFRFEWYPTLDGPAHLYNAHLIKQMVLGNEFLSQFLAFSSFPEPNWSGHAIMAVLSLLLPANFVEKGLVLLIFAGTALAFRALIRNVLGGLSIGTLLIFPFLGAHTLRIGFFNFSISIAVLLWVLAYWHRMRDTCSPKQLVILSMLLGLLYFSNALSTLIGIGTLALWTVWELWLHPLQRTHWLRRLAAIGIASAPWLVLILLFVLRGTGEGSTAYLPQERLWSMVRDGAPFTFQSGQSMILAAQVIAWSMIIMAIILVFVRVRSAGSRSLQSNDFWLIIALLCLVGFTFLPDRAATGGIISIRYLLFFFLFIAIWVAVQRKWQAIAMILLVPFILADLWLVRTDHHFTGELNAEVIEMRSALPQVQDQGIILPLLYTDNWLISNFSNYLGTERGILVIDNYEAMTPHFPLRWRPQHRAPNMERSFFNSNRPCIDIDALGDSVSLRFDHVIRWEYHESIQDSCTVDLGHQLARDFQLEHRSPRGRLELHHRD